MRTGQIGGGAKHEVCDDELTTAECLDALIARDFPHLGDLLKQRLKAVQTATVEGNWGSVQRKELIPTSTSNLVSTSEVRVARAVGTAQARSRKQGACEPPLGIGAGEGTHAAADTGLEEAVLGFGRVVTPPPSLNQTGLRFGRREGL